MTQTSESASRHLLPALRSHVWFASCSAAFQDGLIERSRILTLKSGDRLFSRGETDEALCCVLSGALKLGTFHPEDQTLVMSLFVEPYQWFGEIALIDRLPRSQDAVADGPSTVLVAPRSALEPWFNRHPEYWRDVARLACLKLRMAVVMMEDNATLPLEQQLARRLLMTSTNFGMNYPMSFKRHLRLPQEYLARMMGVSRQTINRALKVLAEQGVIVVRYADIELLDVPGLMSRAGPLNTAFVDSLRALGESADRAVKANAATVA